MVAASVNACGVEAYIGAVTVPVNVGEAIGAAPRFVNAPVAVVAPVPPFTTATVPDKLLAVGATHVNVPFPVVDKTCPLEPCVFGYDTAPAVKVPLVLTFVIAVDP